MADDYEFRVGERCGVDGCRSRRYRTNEGGFDVCERGHQHGISASLAEDDEDDFQGANRGKRFRRQKADKPKNERILKGKDAFEMYLLAYQLVMRKMIWWVMKEQKLSSDFEAVVRDLWALRLQILQERVRPETPSGEDPTAAETNTDDELFSSEEIKESEKQPEGRFEFRKAKINSLPNMRQILAAMNIAFQILRLPFLPADILNWVQSGKLLYQEAYFKVPREMYIRLPTQYQELFRPKIELTDRHLLYEIQRMAFAYNRDFGLEIPPLNVPPLLFRLIEELALPLEVYPAVRRIAVHCQVDFKHVDAATAEVKKLFVSDLPEVQLIICVIAVVKLFYPLHGARLVPQEETSPAAAIMDWDAWEQRMSDEAPLEFLEALQMTDHEALDLPDYKMDQYFNFFQGHFALGDPHKGEPQADFQKTILDLFPLYDQPRKPNETTPKDPVERTQYNVQKTQEALRPNRVIDDEESRDLDETLDRPGKDFIHHKNMLVLKGKWKMFYAVVARVTGIPVQVLLDQMVHFYSNMKNVRRNKMKGGSFKKGHAFKWLSKERIGTSDITSEVRSEMDEADVLVKEGLEMKVIPEEDGPHLEDAQSEAELSDVSMEEISK